MFGFEFSPNWHKAIVTRWPVKGEGYLTSLGEADSFCKLVKLQQIAIKQKTFK